MVLTLALAAATFGCDAPAREALVEDCSNSLDDDEDGTIDCADADCSTKPVCTPEVCGNNLDDDDDGRFDCADTDCAEEPACGGSMCGNAMVDGGEDCDGTNMGGASCITQGFKSGTLACSANCQIDTSACSNVQVESCANTIDDDSDGLADCDDPDCSASVACFCGNGVIDFNEPCDGELLPRGVTCQTMGFPGGTLACAPQCLSFDTSGCAAAICGDSFVSPGETCDDGNTVENDGCSPTCQIELGPLCVGAPALHLGTNTGDTVGGSNGFDASCVWSGGSERVYAFTPAQSGTLIIVLTSSFDHGIYVRTACAEPSSEIACSNFAPGGSSEALSFAVTAGVPLSVIVDTSFESGPFTLTLVLSP